MVIAGTKLRDQLIRYEDSLKELFNVSAVQITRFDAEPLLTADCHAYQPLDLRFAIKVLPASGHKCARCWNFMPEVSNYGIWENVCTRCQSALKEMGIAPPANRRRTAGGQTVSWRTSWPRPRRLPWLLLISALVIAADRLTKTWVCSAHSPGRRHPHHPPRPAHHALDQRGRGLFALRRLGLAQRCALGADRLHARSPRSPSSSRCCASATASRSPPSLSRSSLAEPSAMSTTASSTARSSTSLRSTSSAYHWPDFNVADSSIVIGACLLFLDSLVPHKKIAG